VLQSHHDNDSRKLNYECSVSEYLGVCSSGFSRFPAPFAAIIRIAGTHDLHIACTVSIIRHVGNCWLELVCNSVLKIGGMQPCDSSSWWPRTMMAAVRT